jgi:hypothetical protein
MRSPIPARSTGRTPTVRIARLKQINADQADELAGLPLLHQPGIS